MRLRQSSPVSHPLYPRAGLAAWLGDGRASIWLLQGGPGSGKTCTAQLIAEHLGKAIVWQPGFQDRHPAWDLLAELERAHPAGATVVFDGMDARAEGFLCEWIQLLRDPFATVVTSRLPLTLPLSRKVAMGEAIILGPEELWLSPEEVQEWLGDAQLPRDLVDGMAGWPLGIHCLGAFASRPDRATLAHALVAEEFLAPLPAAVHRLAIRLAPLMRVMRDVVERVGTEPFGNESLECWGLLRGGGWFPLAHRRLIKEWESIPDDERLEGLWRLASWLAEQDPEGAIAMLLAYGEPGLAIDLVVAQAKALAKSNDYVRPLSWVAALPPEAARSPEIVHLEGSIRLRLGEYAEAERLLREAADGFFARSETSRAFGVLVQLLHLHGIRQDQEAFRRVAEEARAFEQEATLEDRARYLNNLAGSCMERGEEDEAAILFRRLLDTPHFGNPALASVHQLASFNLGTLEKRRGDFDEADRHFRRVLRLAEEFPTTLSLPRWARLQLAFIALQLGDRAQAQSLMNQLADGTPALADRYYHAEQLALEGECHLFSGSYDEAEARFREALVSYSELRMEDSDDAGIVLDRLAVIHRRRGEPEAALRLHGKASRMVASRPRYAAAVLLEWALSLWASGAYQDAEAKLGEAARTLEGVVAPHLQARILLAQAVAFERLGSGQLAERVLDTGLGLVRMGPYYYAAIAQREIAPELWGLMSRTGQDAILSAIESRFPAASRAIRAELEQRSSVTLPPVPPAALEVRCFGELQLRVAGEVVAWPRKKAKALLATLLTVPQGIGREELIERLFPDLGWEEADHHMNVLASTLRKTLEPGLERRQRSRYLDIRDKRYRFEREGVWLDIEEFDRLHSEGTQAWHSGQIPQAIAAFDQAIELYRDDLFAEPLLVDAFGHERHRYRTKALESLCLGAAYYVDSEHSDRGRAYAERVLVMEPANEEAHRLLMRLYARFGQYDLLRRQYEHCRRVLREDLDTEPTPETRALFETLTGQSTAL